MLHMCKLGEEYFTSEISGVGVPNEKVGSIFSAAALTNLGGLG